MPSNSCSEPGGRALAYFVEMYDKGRWRYYYKKEEAFAAAVREAREAVDHWTDILTGIESNSGAA